MTSEVYKRSEEDFFRILYAQDEIPIEVGPMHIAGLSDQSADEMSGTCRGAFMSLHIECLVHAAPGHNYIRSRCLARPYCTTKRRTLGRNVSEPYFPRRVLNYATVRRVIPYPDKWFISRNQVRNRSSIARPPRFLGS